MIALPCLISKIKYFGKQFILWHLFFLALRLLHLCDSNIPGMDMFERLVYHTITVRTIEMFDNKDPFGSLRENDDADVL